MVVSVQRPGPYAPASSINEVIDRYRNRGLTRPFTAEVLGRAGISDSLIPRTLQALQTLDLIDDQGNPTETLEAIRRAPEAEYRTQLASWINAVYADVLAFVQPTDDETAIRDAFRAYEPIGQQPRMVSLFIGLCRLAGLRPDSEKQPAARPGTRKLPTPPRKVTPPPAASMRITGHPARVTLKAADVPGLPPAIAGVLSRLPADGGTWTAGERQKFEEAFKAMLDFCFVVSEKTAAKEAEDE